MLYPAGSIFRPQRSGTISTCAGNGKLVRLFLCETPRLLLLAMANRTFSYSPFSDRHSLYCSMYRCVSTQFGWCEPYKIGFSITRRSERAYRQCIDTKFLTSGEECFKAKCVRNLVISMFQMKPTRYTLPLGILI